jgi:hypothetical protein
MLYYQTASHGGCVWLVKKGTICISQSVWLNLPGVAAVEPQSRDGCDAGFAWGAGACDSAYCVAAKRLARKY